MEALEESANLFKEVQKLKKKEKSALIEALKTIEKHIENPKIKDLIEKTINTVENKQVPEKQKTQKHEQTL